MNVVHGQPYEWKRENNTLNVCLEKNMCLVLGVAIQIWQYPITIPIIFVVRIYPCDDDGKSTPIRTLKRLKANSWGI